MLLANSPSVIPDRYTNAMTIEHVTQIAINIGIRNLSGFSDFDAAAPTNSANATINSGLTT